MSIRNLSIRHLRAFVELAQQGSFTTAAGRLFVTQSSLTATIQQLESAIGLKLFDRTTRRVVMTDEARRFKLRADKVIADFDSSLNDLRSYADSNEGHIRICSYPSFIHHFMMDAVDEFRRKYSNITLTLRDASSAQARTLLAGGEVDFAISSMEEAEEFTSVPILSDRYGVVCRKDFHLAESTGPVQWAELGSEHFVGFTPDTGTGTLLQKRLGNLSIVSDPHDEASSTTSLYAFLRRGQCYSILPYLSASMFGDPDLVFRPLARPVLCRDICLVTRRLRAMSPSSERLIEVVNLVVGRKIQGRAYGGFSRPYRRQR